MNKTFFTTALAALLALFISSNASSAPGDSSAAAREQGEYGREKLLMDFNWKFHLGDAPDAGAKLDYPEVRNLAKTQIEDIGKEGELADLSEAVTKNLGADISFVQPKFDDRRWRQLDLPHDWAVELPFDENADVKHGFKPVGKKSNGNNIGWYRRHFDLPAADKGKILWLEFDGVFRNSLVWLNGHCLGRHLSGYTGFRYDISQFANFGGENQLIVRVDASQGEGWFYEGAGIYRHVWLVKAGPVHVAPDGIFVWSSFPNNVPQGEAEIHIQASLVNPQNAAAKMSFDIVDPDGKSVCKVMGALTSPAEQQLKCAVQTPQLWSPESPKLYKLITTVESGGKMVDRVETEFGIRTVAFDVKNGLSLNGKPYTIKGTCNHQDHAGVGSAIPDALQYWRVAKLKEMGGNAYRTSHNPPTPELLEACDRLGLLVMDENRRMDSNQYTLGELKSLILRDRNHPSIFIWSLGNEERPLQTPESSSQAVAIVTAMQNLAHELDPSRLCTVAQNGGYGDGFSKVIDVQGFNYHEKEMDPFHAKFPTQKITGTEIASTKTTRGIYADDKERGYVSAYANEKPGGAPWGWWPDFVERPWASGSFVWTGFDYRGEPTPYKWPCISSQFGIMDTCGFPKDIYYYYQSWWTDKPVLHLIPHWNWPGREGQTILVRCFSNFKEVELFLNGKSLGKKTMQPNQYLDWQVIYAPGVLSAKGYAGGKVIAETKVETTGAPVSIQLATDRTTVNADGQDVSVVTVSVVDALGRVVPVADNLIRFELSGPGKIIGVGNGDPSSHEADKAKERKVFCGLAQVIVQSSDKSGTIQLTAASPELRPATLKIQSKTTTPPPALP